MNYVGSSSSSHWLDGHGEGVVGGGKGGDLPLELTMMMAEPVDVNGGAQEEEGGTGGGCGGMGSVVEREHMFDKVVTPSDVGKLNRLVIPKQHAERYFPLDASANEKGLLLNFEDRNGKPWRFRYSYWNSSQSYVMTKGWSRFVKEKKLDAGDIVSFQRGVGDRARDRLFIDWRRRPDAPPLPTSHHSDFFSATTNHLSAFPSFHGHRKLPPSSEHLHHFLPTWNIPLYPQRGFHHSGLVTSIQPYGYGAMNATSSILQCQSTDIGGSVIYFRSAAGGIGPQPQLQSQQQLQVGMRGQMQGQDPPPLVFESVPVVPGKAAAKRLRLFGVNMDCPVSEDAPKYEECHLSSTSSSLLGCPPFPTSSSTSSSSIPCLQLMPYEGTPVPNMHTSSSSSHLVNQDKASMSWD